MKSRGDLLDCIIDKFRNTKVADIAMYIGSLVDAVFGKND